MPIYEYACGECEARFERYLRAWGETVSCPRCGTEAVEKQVSRVALSSASSEKPAPGAGGACCGGGCGCAR